MSAEARDWDEYLAWTRNAARDQYVATEELAWQRLQSSALRRRMTSYLRPTTIDRQPTTNDQQPPTDDQQPTTLEG